MKKKFMVGYYSAFGENDIQVILADSSEQAERIMLRTKGWEIEDNETLQQAGIFDVEVFSKELNEV